MKKIRSLLPYCALVFAILFNLWLQRPELSITSDPNDNIFQFGLSNQTNIVWEHYGCPINPTCLIRLFDHWVPEWAEGYPLPFYYSHLPQIAIVGSYHLLGGIWGYLHISLFTYYHFVTYLFLSLFPLSLFIATRVMGFSPVAQTFAVILASHLSTDGLYGMDNSSYIWRGYGLSSQLFAWFFMPLAFAFTYRVLTHSTSEEANLRSRHRKLTSNKDTGISSAANLWQRCSGAISKLATEPIVPGIYAIIFLSLTLSSHFGIGYITLLSLIPLLFMSFNRREIIARAKTLGRTVGVTLGLLAYWLIPFLLEANYNAISSWDPVWKFNSFGYFDVLTKLFNGELFDFGRFPVITMLTFVGFFVALNPFTSGHKAPPLQKYQPTTYNLQPTTSLALLFPFWLLLFFGRTTWGPAFDLLPGAAGFHLHRFINGLHLSALFLAPLGTETIINHLGHLSNLRYLKNKMLKLIFSLGVLLVILAIILIPTYRQTLVYAQPNAPWLNAANSRFNADLADFQNLTTRLSVLPPGRIYAGKPGYWGHDFKIGDTPVYMALSVRGFEISQFLPETWSPTSDTEQFFDDRVKSHYDLYNLRYVIAPESVKFLPFVKLVQKFGKFYLYHVDTSGYFSVGKSNLGVLTNRTNYPNLVHLWQISPQVDKKIYPILSFKKGLLPEALTTISLLDPTTYYYLASNTSDGGLRQSTSGLLRGDGRELSIFAKSPIGIPSNYSTPSAAFTNEQITAGQKYLTNVSIPQSCQDCFVVFKMTYHPNWQITVDGKTASKMIVFPFFIGIPVVPGEHTVVASYEPSKTKVIFLLGSFVAIISWIIWRLKQRTAPQFLNSSGLPLRAL